MDPLTDVFSLLDVRVAQFARLEAEAQWGIAFDGYRHVKLGAVLRGTCEVGVEGFPPLRMREGDCYLLGNGRPYFLRSDPDARLVRSAEVFKGFTPGDTVRVGGGADTVVVGCGFHFDEANANVLLDVLPPLVHVPADSPEAQAIRLTLGLLALETSTTAPGGLLVKERLAHVVLVQTMRAHIAEQSPLQGAWLTALADPQVGTALNLIHDSPAHPWTVAELARKAGMSRSHFAARFTAGVGVSPLEYVAKWRIRSAARDLRSGTRTVAAIASSWGYSSESSFSHAFKRIMGQSPGRYRAQARSSLDSDPESTTAA